MSRPTERALPEWRFLHLTLVICGWMLLSPRDSRQPSAGGSTYRVIANVA